MPDKEQLRYVSVVEDEFEKLTDEDWYVLDLAATNIAGNSGVCPNFILKETVKRVLDGRRTWPPKSGVAFIPFLCGTIQSVRNEMLKKQIKAEKTHQEQLPSYSPSPDDCLCLIESEEEAKSIIDDFYKHFEQDEIVQSVIIGKVEGLDCSAILEEARISRLEYDAAMKRIVRYRKRLKK